MNLMIEIIALATFANIFTWHSMEISNFLLDRLKLNFKPFYCNVCLAFWLCFLSHFFFMGFQPIEALFVGGCGYLASHIIFLVLNKNKI